MSCIILNFEKEKLLRSYDKIGRSIIDYIKDMDLMWEIEIARNVYFGGYIDDDINLSKRLKYKPFIQWLIFSYKLNTGSSLIECIYNKYYKDMRSYQRDTLLSLKDTSESLYKVYEIEKSKVLVRDIFTNQELYIWDDLLVMNVKRYAGIFMRVVLIGNKNIPIPGYSVMTNSLLKETEQYIFTQFKEYTKYNTKIPVTNFVKSNSLAIHRYFLNHAY